MLYPEDPGLCGLVDLEKDLTRTQHKNSFFLVRVSIYCIKKDLEYKAYFSNLLFLGPTKKTVFAYALGVPRIISYCYACGK